MRAPDRRAMVERPGKDLSVRRQCTLFNLARSGVYGAKPITGADDLALMRRIDELHLELPFYGSRRMIFERNKEGRGVNRKRVQRLMRVMGIEALVPRPGTSKAAPGHKTYPYLCAAWRLPNRTMCGRPTSPMSRWRSSIGLAARFWPGGCRTRSTAAFASKRLRRLCSDTGSREYSTPIKARSSPAPPSPASLKPLASRFRWTDAAGSWITFSSNGCGARSNMKKYI
jgi:hypothetical protein